MPFFCLWFLKRKIKMVWLLADNTNRDVYALRTKQIHDDANQLRFSFWKERSNRNAVDLRSSCVLELSLSLHTQVDCNFFFCVYILLFVRSPVIDERAAYNYFRWFDFAPFSLTHRIACRSSHRAISSLSHYNCFWWIVWVWTEKSKNSHTNSKTSKIEREQVIHIYFKSKESGTYSGWIGTQLMCVCYFFTCCWFFFLFATRKTESTEKAIKIALVLFAWHAM